ncbi:hypothetical protein Tco_1252569 [Tanacetum coccineum]
MYYDRCANPIVARIFPQRHGKGPSHRKDSNLSAEKRKGRSKQKERKAHHIGQRHQQLKKLTAGFKQKMGERRLTKMLLDWSPEES